MYHEVLEKGKRWLWLMNIIVEGGYYAEAVMVWLILILVWLKNVATIPPFETTFDLRLHLRLHFLRRHSSPILTLAACSQC